MATAVEILNSYSADYVDAEAVSRWMPPDGAGYIGSLGAPSVRVFKNKKSGKVEPIITVKTQLIEGDLKGRECVLIRATPATFGFFKGMLRDVFGEDPAGLNESVEVLKKYQGTAVLFDVNTTTNDSGTYTNADIVEVLPDTVAE